MFKRLFAVKFAVFELFLMSVGFLSLGSVRVCEDVRLESLVRGLLYYGSFSLTRHSNLDQLWKKLQTISMPLRAMSKLWTQSEVTVRRQEVRYGFNRARNK